MSDTNDDGTKKIFVNGVSISVDSDGNVTIEGHNGIKFKSSGAIEFDAHTLRLDAKEKVYVGAGERMFIQSGQRLDLQPLGKESGYKYSIQELESKLKEEDDNASST